MATTILFFFSLCVLCCEVLSVPVLKLKSGDSDDKVERTFVVPKEVLSPDKGVEMAQNFEVPLTSGPSGVDSVKSLSRVKRHFIESHGCSKGTIWYVNRCISIEEYERIKQDEEED